jgi:hypothetical protein
LGAFVLDGAVAAGRADADFAVTAFFVFSFANSALPLIFRSETALPSHGCNVALFQLGDRAAAC